MPPRRLRIFGLIYWIAVAGLFSFAAWQRFSLPLDPIADPDIWGYLGPALKKLTGSDFSPEGRNFIYPGFLFLLLRLFGDFRSITIAQHLLGLAAGGLLLMIWRRARAFVATPRLNPWGHNALGLIAVAIFLFAGDPIRMEMQIRPEGVCGFFLALNIWLAVEFIAGTFVEKRPPSIGVGIALVLTAILLGSLKPSFICLALVSLLPIGFSFLRPGFSSQKIRLAVGAGAGALLLVGPEYFLSRNDYTARMFLPTTLFVVHADMIRDQMADDLEHNAKVPYSREWLSRVHAELSEEIAKSAVAAEPGHHFSFGFSPDYLMYETTSIAVRFAFEFENDPAALTAFYRSYYWRTWRQRPVAMLKKVGRQLAVFYAPMCPAYDRSKFMLLTESYRLGVSSLHRHIHREEWKRYPPAVEFMSRAEALAQKAPPIVQPRFLRRALTLLAGAYLPLLGISLIIAAVASLRRDLRRRAGWLAALTLFVFSYNAAACLEVAILNSLEVPRYTWVQMFFTLLAEFLAVWLVAETFLPQRWGADGADGTHPDWNCKARPGCVYRVSARGMKWLAIPPILMAAAALAVAAPAEPVITREVALKAITIFRDDPLSEDGRGAAAIIVTFADKNHDVLLTLSKKVFPVFGAPGVSQKETGLLLAAYTAGNLDSQLLRGVKRDDPYAGDLQLIETYRQLQKKNPKLKIAALEKMAEMERRGELKRYLSAK